MKKHRFQWFGLMLLAASAAYAQETDVKVDYQKYPDYSPVFNPDYALSVRPVKSGRGESMLIRPSHIDNSKQPYFPPVVSQDGGSCGSAAGIYYNFTYETNCFRGADASVEENQYPTHFTWLLTYSNVDKGIMAKNIGIPNVATYGGKTYSRLFGNQGWTDDDYGWMQGYDKWYSAMFNRITGTANFPYKLDTEQGREDLKNWMWNHNGDPDFHAGGIAGVGVASNGNWQNIPSTPANVEAGVVGMKYVHKWGTSVDHAITLVGYDDRIEFDLDGNGIAGEKDKDEVGAWIVANSWGGWCNGGFIYCPYARGGAWMASDGSQGGFWTPNVYQVRRNYRPLRTFKITMEYSKRSEIRISAGISTNLDATEPDALMTFDHFNYCGDGKNDGVDAETPMLGRWADGVHYEPMEFGTDLTDFSNSFNTRQPLKYFLVIDSKSTADGHGKIHGCSLIDYEFDKNGVELPFELPAEGVEIKNQGGRTIISCVVPGEPLNAPTNLVRNGLTLTWNAPVGSQMPVGKYNIYCDGVCVGEASGTQAAITNEEGIYSVSAVYTQSDGTTFESARSNATLGTYQAPSPRNMALKFDKQGFSIPNLLPKGTSKATIEFWIKPSSLTNYNQNMGPGWGTFQFHASANGTVYVGWDGNQRYQSSSGMLAANTWQHIAIVIDGNVLTFYKNAKKMGSFTSASRSGLGSITTFNVGNAADNGLSALVDEFRFWDEARTPEQIAVYRTSEITMPEAESHLLAYYRMTTPLLEVNGETLLRDYSAQRHHAHLLGGTPTMNVAIGYLKNDMKLAAAIEAETTTTYAGAPIHFRNAAAGSAVKWHWSAPGSKEQTADIPAPVFTFGKPGTYSVVLTVTDPNEATLSDTVEVTITELQKPEAAFTLSADSVAAGDRIMLVNRTQTTGCTYEWEMIGADDEHVYTTHAAASYPKEGTFVITLKATNSAGTSSHSETVTVSKVQPKSIFKVTPAVVMKGETAYLEDQSKYSPDTWVWTLTNPGHTIQMEGATGSIVPQEPGVYDVALKTRNNLGENIGTLKRGLVVCNADSKNGLNFGGGSEYVEFGAPFTATNLRSFSVEWWMSPNRNSTYCHQMGDTEETFLLRTDAMGALTVYAKGKSFTTEKNFIIPSEWHHYAVVYNYGTVSLWRDGERLYSKSLTTRYAPVLGKFRISDPGAPMSGIIDEFRIWSKAINEEHVSTYSNAPIDDVAAAEAEGLLLYCDFNQSSGNVQDATSNKNTGVRVGFGPEGDAWSGTKGVFCLSGKPENVTADYLTNYKAPFISTDKTVSNGARYKQLETGTAKSGWTLENTIENAEKGSTTGFYVDGDHNDNMTVMTFTNGFASPLTDHKAYQTITLPAGNYQFSVTEGDKFSAAGSYLVVNKGTSLPDTEALYDEALAYVPLSDKTLSFALTEETEVSLGMVVNMSGANYLCISSFSLIRSGLSAFEANGITGIASVTKQSPLTVTSETGGVCLETAQPTLVRIYDMAGNLLFEQTVNGMQRVNLSKGIYSVNGKKVFVK